MTSMPGNARVAELARAGDEGRGDDQRREGAHERAQDADTDVRDAPRWTVRLHLCADPGHEEPDRDPGDHAAHRKHPPCAYKRSATPTSGGCGGFAAPRRRNPVTAQYPDLGRSPVAIRTGYGDRRPWYSPPLGTILEVKTRMLYTIALI